MCPARSRTGTRNTCGRPLPARTSVVTIGRPVSTTVAAAGSAVTFTVAAGYDVGLVRDDRSVEAREDDRVEGSGAEVRRPECLALGRGSASAMSNRASAGTAESVSMTSRTACSASRPIVRASSLALRDHLVRRAH